MARHGIEADSVKEGDVVKAYYGTEDTGPDPEKCKTRRKIRAGLWAGGIIVVAVAGGAAALWGESVFAKKTMPDILSERADGVLEAKDYIPDNAVEVFSKATLIRVPCVPGEAGGRVLSFSGGPNNSKPVVMFSNGPFDIDADGRKFASADPAPVALDLNNPTEATAFLTRATKHCAKPPSTTASTATPSSSLPPTTTVGR